MTNGKAILAILAGVATGAVLGMLMTSKKRSGMQKKIAKRGEDFADALNEKIDQKFEELLTTMTGKIKQAVSQKNESLIDKDDVPG
jgi:hypothetical protein